MCGILGVVSSALPTQGRFKSALATIHHRGPDCSALVHLPGAIFGHQRLSIIDLSPASNQPFEGTDSVLVFNGEVYNFRQLRTELEELGEIFRTSGDAEVISKGYSVWGLGVVQRLRGMFALALYDRLTKEVHLARDPFGIKPLYVRPVTGGIAFASESKPLLQFGESCNVSPDTLLDTLVWGFPLSHQSFFQSVRQIQPGTIVTIRNGTMIESGDARRSMFAATHSNPVASKQLQGTISDSVKDHMVADVPIAIALSGGLDSSIVAAIAADHCLTAVTTTFLEKDDPEVEYAAAIANRCGLRHEVVRLEVRDLESLIADIVYYLEEPIANPSIFPSFCMAQSLHAMGFKVVLMGEGADEIFAGYPWHESCANLSGDPASLFNLYRSRRGQLNGVAILTSEAVESMGRRESEFAAIFHREFHSVKGSPLTRMLSFEQAYQLQFSQLLRVDRMTMAHGVEARLPYLYEPVLRLSNGLFDSQKVKMYSWQRGRTNKIALARAFDDRIPEVIAMRPKFGPGGSSNLWSTPLMAQLATVFERVRGSQEYSSARAVLEQWIDWSKLSSTVGSEAWNSRDLKSRPH